MVVISGVFQSLAPAFQFLMEHWLSVIGANVHEHMEYTVDSCPVILVNGYCSGHAKVAGKLCGKSYNSSRNEWYCRLKIYAFMACKPDRLPVPLSVMTSGAAQHNLPAAKQIMENCLYLKQG